VNTQSKKETMILVYKPVTILSENEHGQIGVEEWPELTKRMIAARCRELSDFGWEPIEIQVDEAQGTLTVDWTRGAQ
jgi:hypothetical protein